MEVGYCFLHPVNLVILSYHSRFSFSENINTNPEFFLEDKSPLSYNGTDFLEAFDGGEARNLIGCRKLMEL